MALSPPTLILGNPGHRAEYEGRSLRENHGTTSMDRISSTLRRPEVQVYAKACRLHLAKQARCLICGERKYARARKLRLWGQSNQELAIRAEVAINPILPMEGFADTCHASRINRFFSVRRGCDFQRTQSVDRCANWPFEEHCANWTKGTRGRSPCAHVCPIRKARFLQIPAQTMPAVQDRGNANQGACSN